MGSSCSSDKCSTSCFRLSILLVLCLQNSIFTVLRRYSLGVLKETYSKHEVLVLGEVIKLIFSSYMIRDERTNGLSLTSHLHYLTKTSSKMFILAFIYGLMNILSFVALKSISAGMFTICAQLKILTTALFSRLLLQRQYSYVKWRALISLMAGVIIFSESTWNNESAHQSASTATSFYLGTAAVLTEVTLSGFASIYFEKVIKSDPEQLSIWERNFQLALGSIPVYALFILNDGGGEGGYFSGWSFITVTLAFLGAAGGILVALSIKHTDSILKTLATTGAIVLSSILDHMFLGGPLNLSMTLSGTVVVNSICDYTFDPSPTTESAIIKEVSPISSDIHKKNDSYIEVPKFFPTDEKPARIDSP